MKKKIILLLLVIITTCFICGCTSQSQSGLQTSDDTLYMNNLEDFLSSNPDQSTQAHDAYSLQMKYAQTKVLAITFYNRFEPLKVSSKYELSKNSLLQFLKEMEWGSDFYLNHYSLLDKNYNLMTSAEKEQYAEFQTRSRNSNLFLRGAFDSNICSLENEKYTNVTKMCKNIQSYPI